MTQDWPDLLAEAVKESLDASSGDIEEVCDQVVLAIKEWKAERKNVTRSLKTLSKHLGERDHTHATLDE